ncbi:class I SAM-dependent methyltransferase [Cyclobacterium xiamenense]|uniref:class I SAM-dependent methyltransferase n=1 Tax=Cyclobacterium xiamenense TaxID=1297121 RepID=UPI0035CEB727
MIGLRKKVAEDPYCLIAPVYDFLSQLVFGKDFQRSRTVFLDRIRPGNTVLVLGGGTGSILPQLLNRCGTGGRILYLEPSQAMLRRARQRLELSVQAQIEWVHSSQLGDLPAVKLDAIVSHYLLDVLPDEGIDRIFLELQTRIHSETRWLFADFFPISDRRWLLVAMICLFRWFARHPRKDLPDYESFFQKWGWKELDRIAFQRGFFRAMCYQLAPKSINLPITSLK